MDRRQRRSLVGFVPCMNDTKWREVFLIASSLELQFHLAWVYDSDWPVNSLHRVPKNLIDHSGIRDPGIGGPCDYREILWVRFPRRIPSGYWGPREQQIEQLDIRLDGLGVLPVTSTVDYLEVRGYNRSSSSDQD